MNTRILNLEDIGKVVRNRRRALELTQLEAAGLCGVGDRFLRELEHGKATVELGKVLSVLHGLGIAVHLSENRDR